MLKKSFIAGFLIFAVLISTPSAFGADLIITGNENIVKESAKTDNQAFSTLLYCFSFYSSFFADTYTINNCIISIHGETYAKAQEYLENGFDKELAADIVSYYTRWNPELRKQTIIPCDGLPVITSEDLSSLRYEIQGDTIIFSLVYENCYMSGTYMYKVFMKKTDQGFKIFKIELEEITPAVTS